MFGVEHMPIVEKTIHTVSDYIACVSGFKTMAGWKVLPLKRRRCQQEMESMFQKENT